MKRAQLCILIIAFAAVASAQSAEPKILEYNRSGNWVSASDKPMALRFDEVMKGLEDCFEMKVGVIEKSRAYQGRSPTDAGLEIIGKKSAITTAKLLISLYKYDEDTYDLNVAILSRFMNNCVPGLLDHKDWLKKAFTDQENPLGSRTVFGNKLIDVMYLGKGLRVVMITIQSK